MGTNKQKPATEEVKIDLFDDEDEFEEFEIDQDWDEKKEGEEITQQWEDDWDDDDGPAAEEGIGEQPCKE